MKKPECNQYVLFGIVCQYTLDEMCCKVLSSEKLGNHVPCVQFAEQFAKVAMCESGSAVVEICQTTGIERESRRIGNRLPIYASCACSDINVQVLVKEDALTHAQTTMWADGARVWPLVAETDGGLVLTGIGG